MLRGSLVDKTVSAIIVLAILVVALGLMVLGWRARKRRQSTLPAPYAAPEVAGNEYGTFESFYVATTIAREPLNRVAVHGLGFRARCDATVTDSGVLIAIGGQPDIYIPLTDIREVQRATWTIDRVVEEGGLILIGWTLGDTEVDSYFRAEEPEAFLSALTSLRATTESESK